MSYSHKYLIRISISTGWLFETKNRKDKAFHLKADKRLIFCVYKLSESRYTTDYMTLKGCQGLMIQKQNNIMILTLCALAICLNVAVGSLMTHLQMPFLYLDAIGTIFIAFNFF